MENSVTLLAMLLAKCQEERLKGSTQHQSLSLIGGGGLNTVYRWALNPSPGRVTPCVIGGSPKQARPSRVPTLGRVSIGAYQ